MRRIVYVAAGTVLLSLVLSAVAGWMIAPGMLHPRRGATGSLRQVACALEQIGAEIQQFDVRASDGILLRGWKVRPPSPGGDWVLLFHGVTDNRTGMLGQAKPLLRHGYGVLMMDSRAHRESGGNMATYGWKERDDTVAITNALYANEQVRHLYAVGVSMGAAIALQAAAVEPRVDAVVAEDPFANLREVSYDYSGLRMSPVLGKTLFRPASFFGMREIERKGGFNPDDVSPEKAVAIRPFAILLICGAYDRRIPCRHAERIYEAARGPKELWIVRARHAAAFGQEPREYEARVVDFFQKH